MKDAFSRKWCTAPVAPVAFITCHSRLQTRGEYASVHNKYSASSTGQNGETHHYFYGITIRPPLYSRLDHRDCLTNKLFEPLTTKEDTFDFTITITARHS